MGHLRLGRLPKYRRWREVVDLLDAKPGDTSLVARSTVIAAEDYLRSLASDPSLTYCFWLLCRITWASRFRDFQERVSSVGMKVGSDAPTLAFVAALSDQVREHLAQYSESGPVSALASLALKRSLTETVGVHGASLFGSTVEDLQNAFHEYSTQAHFGELSQRFFGDFLARTLRSYLDRELANHIGEGRPLSSIRESQEFLDAIDLHCRQSARIVRDFAGSWYSKHNWKSMGEVSQKEALWLT